MNLVHHSPLLPRCKVHLHLLVNKAVCQRRGHAIGHAFVAFTIACGNHNHIVRQFILANSAVQDQLISRRLDASRSRVHFVQEQHHNGIFCGSFFIGKVNRRRILHDILFFVVERNTTNVSGFHLAQTQVNHQAAKFFGNAFHKLTLANTRRAPQEQGTFDLECLEQGFTGLQGGDGATI